MLGLNELLDSVCRIQPEITRNIIEESMITIDELENALWYHGMIIPLYYIPKCWSLVLGADIFENEDKKHISMLYENNKIIMQLMEDKWNIDFDTIEIPYSEFDCGILFKSDKDDTVEECLAVDISELKIIYDNFREIDIDLYCAVDKLDIKLTRRLLEKGASPFVYIHSKPTHLCPTDEKSRIEFYVKNDAMNVCDRVIEHIIFPLYYRGFMHVILHMDKNANDFDYLISVLFDTAAHVEIRNLLLEFCDREQKIKLDL